MFDPWGGTEWRSLAKAGWMGQGYAELASPRAKASWGLMGEVGAGKEGKCSSLALSCADALPRPLGAARHPCPLHPSFGPQGEGQVRI